MNGGLVTFNVNFFTKVPDFAVNLDVFSQVFFLENGQHMIREGGPNQQSETASATRQLTKKAKSMISFSITSAEHSTVNLKGCFFVGPLTTGFFAAFTAMVSKESD